jgi:hypothetical protein
VIGEGGAELNGGGAGAPLVVRHPVDVRVTDVTLADGAGVGVVLGELTAGGLVECDGATVELERVRLVGGTADVGAAIFATNGCDLYVGHGEITGNLAGYYGGGIAVVEATAEIMDTTVSGNEAAYGGGVAVVSSEVYASELTLIGNGAGQGGGAIVEDGDLRLDWSEIYGNVATSGGGVLLDLATLGSYRTAWGEGADDNAPDDVSASTEELGDDETFTCDDAGCER